VAAFVELRAAVLAPEPRWLCAVRSGRSVTGAKPQAMRSIAICPCSTAILGKSILCRYLCRDDARRDRTFQKSCARSRSACHLSCRAIPYLKLAGGESKWRLNEKCSRRSSSRLARTRTFSILSFSTPRRHWPASRVWTRRQGRNCKRYHQTVSS
jgi:hypothetical protein